MKSLEGGRTGHGRVPLPSASACPEPPLASREGSHFQCFLSLTRKTHLTPQSLLLLYFIYIMMDPSRSVVLSQGWLHPPGHLTMSGQMLVSQPGGCDRN